MKKFILSFCLLLLLGCSKDDTPNTNDNNDDYLVLEIKDIVKLIGRTPEQVKSDFKGDLLTETGDGGALLNYTFQTDEVKYKVSFYTNQSGVVNKIALLGYYNGSYNETLTYFKAETDKAASIYSGKYYFAMLYEGGSSLKYESRSDFWTATGSASEQILSEHWLIINGEEIDSKLIYQEVCYETEKSTNKILIVVEQQEYSL